MRVGFCVREKTIQAAYNEEEVKKSAANNEALPVEEEKRGAADVKEVLPGPTPPPHRRILAEDICCLRASGR